MRLFWRRPPAPPCPIRALADKLVRRGWVSVMPVPIPESCYRGACGHLPGDRWARDYAARGQRIADGVEDGRYTPAEALELGDALFEEAMR